MAESSEQVKSQQKNGVAKMSNELARSKIYVSTVYEARIIANLIAQIDSNDITKKYCFDASEVIHSDGGDKYAAIKSACEKLMGKYIKVEDRKKQKFSMYTVFTNIDYEKGLVYCQFHEKMKPHLLMLKDHFTKIPLDIFLKIQSTYTQKLFNFLWSWKSEGKIVFDLEDMWDRFQCPQSYKKWAIFQRRVIDPGVKEINKLLNSNITYTPIKRSRKYVRVEFDLTSIKDMKNQTYVPPKKDDILDENTKEIFDLLIKYKINNTQAKNLAKKITEYDIEKNWVEEKTNKMLERYEILASKNVSMGGYIYKGLSQDVDNIIEMKGNYKERKEQMQAIRNKIAQGEIDTDCPDQIHSGALNSLNAYLTKGYITDQEFEVIKKYITFSEYQDMYTQKNEFQEKNRLSDEDGYKHMVELMFITLAEKLS